MSIALDSMLTYRIFLNKNCALVICPSSCLINQVIEPPCNSYRRSNRAILLPIIIIDEIIQ
jgi:hypothetical protein